MSWTHQLANYTDLALGLMLSVVLGSMVGLTMSHPLGHLLFGSALGVTFLVMYVLCFTFGAIRMMGAQQGLMIVSTFVWCILLSFWLMPHPEVSSMVDLF